MSVSVRSSISTNASVSTTAVGGAAAKEDTSDTLAGKIVHVLCYNSLCRELCDSCLQKQPVKKKIQKEDIEHVIQCQPTPSVSSTSVVEDTPLKSPAPPLTPHAPRTPTYSSSHPHHMPNVAPIAVSEISSLASFRDRMDSDDSSRKGSTSSGSDYRRSPGPFVTPVIDMKPIEFWTATNRETVQPRTPKRRLNSESDFSLENFNPDLYEVIEEKSESLTDEEKLAQFKLGELHVNIQYEIPNNILVVKVIEAKDIPLPCTEDGCRLDNAHSNPYVKVTLLPHHKNSHQTTVQKKTQNPVWNETVIFDTAFRKLQDCTLNFIVKDFDKYSMHVVRGQCSIPLNSLNLIKGTHLWKPLIPCSSGDEDLGELLLSLNFLPCAGRLNVDVIKANQLLQTDMQGGSDPFVKIILYINGVKCKSKKTSVKRNTINPVFNESLNFNVTAEQIHSCSVSVSVWDYNSKSKDDFVGQFVLGQRSTGEKEDAHWTKMLQSQRSSVAQWHTLLRRDAAIDTDLSSVVSSMG